MSYMEVVVHICEKSKNMVLSHEDVDSREVHKIINVRELDNPIYEKV